MIISKSYTAHGREEHERIFGKRETTPKREKKARQIISLVKNERVEIR